jgi:hypothetical protein
MYTALVVLPERVERSVQLSTSLLPNAVPAVAMLQPVTVVCVFSIIRKRGSCRSGFGSLERSAPRPSLAAIALSRAFSATMPGRRLRYGLGTLLAAIAIEYVPKTNFGRPPAG